MQVVVRSSLDQLDVDALVVGIPEGSDSTDSRFSEIARPLFGSGDLPLKALEIFVVGGKPKIVFVGIARNQDAQAWQRAAATVVRKVSNTRSIAFTNGDARAITEGALV